MLSGVIANVLKHLELFQNRDIMLREKQVIKRAMIFCMEKKLWSEMKKIDTEVLFEILYIAKILSLYKLVVYVD